MKEPKTHNFLTVSCYFHLTHPKMIHLTIRKWIKMYHSCSNLQRTVKKRIFFCCYFWACLPVAHLNFSILFYYFPLCFFRSFGLVFLLFVLFVPSCRYLQKIIKESYINKNIRNIFLLGQNHFLIKTAIFWDGAGRIFFKNFKSIYLEKGSFIF